MTTNREWLYALDVADLTDWFDAEHVDDDGVSRSNDGVAAEYVDAQQDNNGTCPIGNGTRPNTCNNSGENVTDSRFKLETDIHRWLTSHVAVSVYAKDVEAEVYGWLDRQAAITEQECAWRWQQIAEARDRAEIERDALAADLKECMEQNDKLSDERERWRGTCGMMTDAAHEIERILAEMEAK